jgi:hypothetical protein
MFPESISAFGKTYIPRSERPGNLYRVEHWVEQTGNTRPYGRPEVEPLFPNQHVPFGEPWQRLSKAMNPRISAQKWTSVYDSGTWMTNNQGFGMAGDPRANFILGTNLTSALPRVELLTGGGSLLTGREEGANLVVDVLDWRDDPPSAEWMLAHPWFYVVAVIAHEIPRRFEQGEQSDGSTVPIYHPLLGDPSRFPRITIPLAKVQRWTAAELPDPYKVYL